jgi:hypothetical protein
LLHISRTAIEVDAMLAVYAKRWAPAFFAVATLSLSAPAFPSAAVAQTVKTEQDESPAVLAAREYLQAMGYKSRMETRFAAIAKSKIALKIMMEREPLLEAKVAKAYAARLTADELREIAKFFRTPTGTMYFNFNTEINANPYATPEIYRNEVAKRFTAQQRAEVYAYVSSSAGRKMSQVLPDLIKAEREAGDQWGQETQQEIDRAIRAGEEVS